MLVLLNFSLRRLNRLGSLSSSFFSALPHEEAFRSEMCVNVFVISPFAVCFLSKHQGELVPSRRERVRWKITIY